MSQYTTTFQDAYAEFVPGFDNLTMFYGTPGNALVEIGSFDTTYQGVILLEHSQSGGQRWGPCNGLKLGRGMTTNCTAQGLTQFRVPLDAIGMAGFRVRCRDTAEMQPISIKLTFGGQIVRHHVRAESKFVIAEAPDIRDLVQ